MATKIPKVLAIIPARGGSKGLPRKNLLEVGGKPLIAWTIEAAKNAKCVTRLILSSDNDEIIDTAKTFGCDIPFKRPPELATDTAGSLDVVLHALTSIPGYDYVILLQPTSPLRSAEDIDSAFSIMVERDAATCVSVCPVDESPYWMYRFDNGNIIKPVMLGMERVLRRQDLEPIYILNGAIYIARVEHLILHRSFLGDGCVGYVMPRERSIDIDTEDDFKSFSRLIDFSS